MIELIISILTLILFLAVLWFAIYITWGTDISGRNPSAFGTTTMLFIVILIIIGMICGIIWLILKTFSVI